MSKLFPLIALAGALMCAAMGSAEPEGSGNSPAAKPLTLNVAVLPFYSTAPADGDSEQGGDPDGYRAVVARAGSVAGKGSAAVVADRITASKMAVGLVATQRPKELAPLQLQAVFLAFQHRPAKGAQAGWEAYVEVAAEVKDTRTGAQLLNRYYQATAPAKGPLPVGVRQEIFRRGISAYAETPLGQAFEAVVRQIVFGPTAGADGSSADTAGEAAAGVLPLCVYSTWEGRVTRRDGAGVWIEAGADNGLKDGEVLTPYKQTDLPGDAGGSPTPSRELIPGQLRVQQTLPHAALLVPGGATPVDPAHVGDIAVVHYAQLTVDEKGFDIVDAPIAFLNRLKLKVAGFESRSHGAWPRDSIFVKEDEARTQGHSLTLVFLNAFSRKPITEWSGVVFENNAAHAAEECFSSIRPTLMAAAGSKPVAADAVQLPTESVAPKAFVNRLGEHLRELARNAENAWPPATLQLAVSVTGNMTTVTVNDGRKDRGKPEPIKDARWTGSVADLDAATKADECFLSMKTPLLAASASIPANAAGGVSLAAYAEAQSGDVQNAFQNRRQDFHLSLRLAPTVAVRKDGTYLYQDLEHPVRFLVRSDANVWLMVYYVDKNREVGPAWKYNKITKTYEAIRIEANVETPLNLKVAAGDKGLEYLVAVAWKDQQRAVNLAAAHPASIGEFADQVRTLAVSKNGAPDVDLKGFAVDPDPVPAEPLPATSREVLASFQQAAGRFANQENGRYGVAWLQYRTAGK